MPIFHGGALWTAACSNCPQLPPHRAGASSAGGAALLLVVGREKELKPIQEHMERRCCISILQLELSTGVARWKLHILRHGVTARRWGGGSPRPTGAPDRTSLSCGFQFCSSFAFLHTFHVFDCSSVLVLTGLKRCQRRKG